MQHLDSVGPEGNERANTALKSRLVVAENVLAVLAVDLDAQLHFGTGLVALTNQRLLAQGPDGTWHDWPLTAPGLELQLTDYAGVGTLDLLGAAGRLGRWRHTLGAQLEALRLVRLFGQIRRTGEVAKVTVEDGDATPLDPEIQKPPSTWVLLRLGRFARPYRKQLLAA